MLLLSFQSLRLLPIQNLQFLWRDSNLIKGYQALHLYEPYLCLIIKLLFLFFNLLIMVIQLFESFTCCRKVIVKFSIYFFKLFFQICYERNFMFQISILRLKLFRIRIRLIKFLFKLFFQLIDLLFMNIFYPITCFHKLFEFYLALIQILFTIFKKFLKMLFLN